MIRKMNQISIMGLLEDFDNMSLRYLSKYNIHLEQASTHLKEMYEVEPIVFVNPYTSMLEKARTLVGVFCQDYYEDIDLEISKEKAVSVMTRTLKYYEEKDVQLIELDKKRKIYNEAMESFSPYVNLNVNLEDLVNFKSIKYRLGKMPIRSFQQFETFLYASPNILFLESIRDKEYIWGIFFISPGFLKEAESVLKSFNMEFKTLPHSLYGDTLTGSLKYIYVDIKLKLDNIRREISNFYEQELIDLNITKINFILAYRKIYELHYYYETRRFALKTQKNFYILTGYIAKDEAKLLENDCSNDTKVIVDFQPIDKISSTKPPTELKNLGIFKPFELFVNMYSRPDYDEIDPTPVLAITYIILFGIMFGDVGQGLVMSLLGLALYKFKKSVMGNIIAICGCSSIFFGFIYGSVFGFEDILNGCINVTQSVSQILITTVSLGILIIFISMTFNIINCIFKNNLAQLVLSSNGICGFIFYSSCVYMILSFFIPSIYIPSLFLSILMIVSLLCILFSHHIAWFMNLSQKKPNISVMSVLESFIELFEVMLGYFTSTLSFVRVGAFALSHASIMSVVLSLAHGENGYNLLVIILGNILVIALEGLVAGIQTLRLEFYEIFSRFFIGNGRKFISYKNQLKYKN